MLLIDLAIMLQQAGFVLNYSKEEIYTLKGKFLMNLNNKLVQSVLNDEISPHRLIKILCLK